ncbi:MAG: hypothetical protein ACREO3_00970, partial [Arenimonas sp.]
AVPAPDGRVAGRGAGAVRMIRGQARREVARCGLLATTLFAASCSHVASRDPDRMCPEISRFALASKQGTVRSVSLSGGWGGEAGALMTNKCIYSGYPPGKVLCEYLMPNTSWEFGERNAMRAVTCLDAKERHDVRRKLEAGAAAFKLTSSLQEVADKSVQVTVEFGHDPHGLTVLTLAATRVGVP